jgi:hypothetical protein
MRHDGASGALDRIFAQSRWQISVSATPIATAKRRFPSLGTPFASVKTTFRRPKRSPETRRFDFPVLAPFIKL